MDEPYRKLAAVIVVLVAAGVITGASAAAEQPAGTAVDLSSVPVSRAQLSGFPFFDFPAEVAPAYRRTRSSDFDAAAVIVGRTVQTVEGRVEERAFSYNDARMSADAARQKYRTLATQLGGVKVNAAAPADADFVAAYGNDPALRFKRLRMDDAAAGYETYLIRTPAGKRFWIVLMFATNAMKYLAIEERPMEQTVHFIKPR